MTPPNRPHTLPVPTPAARADALARDARRRRARARTCTALACASVLWAGVAQARKPHAPKAASAPSTAQILAPSLSTVPDALPVDKQVWRCGSSYSARPCAGADSAPLDVADGRSDAQRRQSRELVARDQRLAAWYEAGRHERETIASAPARARMAGAPPACVSTDTMRCVPKTPAARRTAVRPATRGASAAGRQGSP